MESEAAIGTVTNLGSGFEISIGDTASAIATAMNVEIEIGCDADRLRPEGSEVERLFSSYAKAERLTGWKPQYVGLEGFRRGLTKTITWFTSGNNMARYKADRYNL